MAWERKISRTIRVRNDQKLGLLAHLLTSVSDMGGTVGDIVLLNENSRSVIRDITIYGDDVQHIEKLVNAIASNPGTKILEVRDQVLELHQKGKIAIRSRYPLELNDHPAPGLHARRGRSMSDDRRRIRHWPGIIQA